MEPPTTSVDRSDALGVALVALAAVMLVAPAAFSLSAFVRSEAIELFAA